MNQQMAAAHREAFLDAMHAGIAVVSTGGEVIRNRDVHYRFRPHSDFWYLTGFREPDAVAVLRPGHDQRYVLFVRPRDPLQETWHGRRAGVEGARQHFGADQAFPVEELDARLPELLKGHERLYYQAGRDAEFDRRLLSRLHDMRARTRDGVDAPDSIVDPGTLLHEMRLHKSPDEQQLMRRCAAITDQAHRAAMAWLQPGQLECEVEALVDSTFRTQGGWGPGYPTIAAGGANACVLHYITNDAPVRDGDLLLLDAGCELGGYTADVTRTFPASGRFSPAQRDLYEVVLAAQRRGVQQVAPGHSFVSVHEATRDVLVAGMIDLGLLRGGLEQNVESGAYRRYYMHRTGHWLGLDVHDVGAYHLDGAPSRPLQPGMVTTVEPGLYVAPDDEQAPAALRGIGIRIEDDVLVTADGCENLTASIPRTVEEVEAAC